VADSAKDRRRVSGAVLSGFSHLGRLSNAYKQAFGESPSDTLARAATANATVLKA